MNAAVWVALLCVAAILVVRARVEHELAEPVDSYVCLQAETNRIPNAGCRWSRSEKVGVGR